MQVSEERVLEALQSQLSAHQLLFWNDPEGEFSDTVGNLSLEGIHLVRVDQVSAFQVKMEIEAAPLDRWLL